MKAFLNNYRQSPRKVRLVAGLIRGKGVELALVELDFLPKRASLPIRKLLLSAVSNAKALGIEKENLFIKEVRVDKGVTLRRMMPAAMGSGHRINKRTCHIALFLGEKDFNKKTKQKVTKETTSKVNKTSTVEKVEKKLKKIVSKKTK